MQHLAPYSWHILVSLLFYLSILYENGSLRKWDIFVLTYMGKQESNFSFTIVGLIIQIVIL